MKLQESAENYLEAIYILQNRNGSVRSIDIARDLGYSKPSVSRAMKLLRENDYITMEDDGSIKLTAAGATIAENMYERHAFLSQFLTDLGVDEKTAAEDACNMEHDMSEKSFGAIQRHIEEWKQGV